MASANVFFYRVENRALFYVQEQRRISPQAILGPALPAVDDHGAADDILHAEAVREKDGEGVAAAAEERRQVPGVLGVRAVVRIEMAPNVGKGVAAVAGTAGPGMDVKGKDRVAAGSLRLRQAGDMGRRCLGIDCCPLSGQWPMAAV